MLIYNAKIIPCEGENIENGFIAFENEKITALGDMTLCPTVREGDMDAKGATVLPGFIDPHCHVGCGPEAIGSSEYSELSDPIVPHYDAMDAFFPMDGAIRKCLKRGITTIVMGPGSTTLIGGQLGAFKLNGKFAPEACIKRACAIKFALGEAPRSVFKFTRMGYMAKLRAFLDKCRYYMENHDKVPYDAKCEAMIPLLKGEIVAHVHAQRADDMRAAVQLSKEYGIRLAILHAVQAPKLIDEMLEVGAATIQGPLMFTSRDLESDGISYKTPIITQQAGILTTVCTDACPGLGHAQMLPVNASLLVREGMDYMEAIKTITINAARVNSIDDRVGSLKVGKDADIVVFDGDPLAFDTKVKAVFVDGRRVEL